MSSRLGLVSALALLTAGCESKYSLPPTPCDDHCLATQRADCSDDEPAECVRDCESGQGPHAGEACLDSWRTLDDCLLRAPASAFFCANDHSEIADICLVERRALSECVAPGSGACFDECLRRAQTCGAPLSDCEDGCRQAKPSCAAESGAYYECLRGNPVDCTSGDHAGARSPGEIPCYDQALELLACAK